MVEEQVGVEVMGVDLEVDMAADEREPVAELFNGVWPRTGAAARSPVASASGLAGVSTEMLDLTDVPPGVALAMVNR